MGGGSCEIRTHGGLASSAVFKTAGLNHSPKLPDLFMAFGFVPLIVSIWAQGQGIFENF
jgi:hypothetical protein